MAVRKLPDLTPERVVQLQDALLANADALLTSALAVLDLGHVALARSLAILGLEESGKAIAVHERRMEMSSAPEGEPFRCAWLDELWASHQRKLDKVHGFLLLEPYWLGQPPDSEENAAYLGTIRAWSRRHDRSKQRGFYVDLGKTGAVLAPADAADEGALRDVIAYVHQIGWQLRLGEHIEGKRQGEQGQGSPPVDRESLMWLHIDPEGDSPYLRRIAARMRSSLSEEIPGKPLNNASYRFNPHDADRTPFRNLGKPGYEAQTRELLRLEEKLDPAAERGDVIPPKEGEE